MARLLRIALCHVMLQVFSFSKLMAKVKNSRVLSCGYKYYERINNVGVAWIRFQSSFAVGSAPVLEQQSQSNSRRTIKESKLVASTRQDCGIAQRTFPAAISRRAITISRLSDCISGLAPFKSCFARIDASMTSEKRLGT